MNQKLWAAICLLILLPAWALAQTPIIVTGKVTDETGATLPGANVSIVNHAFGSATDPDGNYRFLVDQALLDREVQLRVSFVGHRSRVKTVALTRGINEHDFALAVDILNIEEIMVTAMGVGVAREKLGVTIGKVDPRHIVNSDESNIVSALSGKVANVEITRSSGDPGAGAYIRIRGANSITGGTQPLFVVDGSPINNQSIFNANRPLDLAIDGTGQQNRASDLNPEDIESVEILKGAAAAAMYGSRAANGVVLITTKSGKPGKPRLSYKLSYSFDQATHMPLLQRKYGQGAGGQFIPGIPLSWGPNLEASGTPTYDHASELFETGHTIENNLSLSGGNDQTTYYLSLGRSRTDGVLKGNADYIRDAFRLKASQALTDRLRITGNFSLAMIESNRIQQGSNSSGLLLGALRTPPDFDNLPYIHPETGFHRSYRTPNPTALSGSRGYDNPFFVLNEHTNLSEVTRYFGNAQIEYDLRPGLTVNYALGYDVAADERRTVFPLGNSVFPNGRVVRDAFTTREIDGNLIITAIRGFRPASTTLTLMAGQNLNQTDYREYTTRGDGLAVDDVDLLGNAATFTAHERREKVRIEGYFAQALVDMWDQLYMTIGMRNDGASVFGQGNKRHWYPKISSAWNFTHFNGLPNPAWLNFGKVRAAYGETGRIPAAYSTITGYATEVFQSDWGEQLSSTAYGYGGFITDRLKGQENIKPERAKEFEIGIDLGLLNHRLGLDATYYNQKTTDLIYALPVPPSTGFQYQVQNAGAIANKGIEIGLHAQPINRKDIKWILDIAYARNRNKVTELPGAEFLILGPFEGGGEAHGAIVEGYPVSVHRVTDFVRFGRGVVVNGVAIDQAYSGWEPNDLYIAEHGYPIKDPELRVLGDPNPDWTGSIRNTATLYGNLQFSILIDIRNGGHMWNGTKGALYFFGTHKDTEDREGTQVFDGIGPGQGMAVSKGETWYTLQTGSLFRGVNSPFLEDGGYVKLREVAISYALKNKWVNKLGLSDIDLRLSGRNLKTWTDYTGIDPESNVTGVSNLRGFDFFNNPNARSFVFTLRLNY